MASFQKPFIDFKAPVDYPKEIFAGIAVAMTMIPESISFAILAGLSPLVGLYAAFLMGLLTSILGGRPGMVSGGAGSTVVVLMALAVSHGAAYLFAAVVFAGIFQFIAGALKWGKFVRLIPKSVMFGFLNGLAIIIFMAQVVQFRVLGEEKAWLSGSALWIMLGLAALAILCSVFLPKLTTRIPGSLLAIVVVSLIVLGFGITTRTLGDIASVSGGFPKFSIPAVPFTLETLRIILPYSLLMAIVGLVESLLTLQMVDDMTDTRGSSNREAMAQGVANFVNGFFGSMGGCAMVAQTLVNVEAGSRTRLSGFIGALVILIFILFAGPLIEQIPIAALVGVMMVVAFHTFEWLSVRILHKMPVSDLIVAVLVTLITALMNDLALAVVIGVVISALVYTWQSSNRMHIDIFMNDKGQKVYQLHGPLFFGTVHILERMTQTKEDPARIVLDFQDSYVADLTAIRTLEEITEEYNKNGTIVVMRNLSEDSYERLDKADSLTLIYQDKKSATKEGIQ